MTNACKCPSCGASLAISTNDRMDRPHEPGRPQQPAGPRPQRQPTPTTFAEAAAYRLPFGRYLGETLADVDRADPGYIEWGLSKFDRDLGKAVALYVGGRKARAEPRDRQAETEMAMSDEAY